MRYCEDFEMLVSYLKVCENCSDKKQCEYDIKYKTLDKISEEEKEKAFDIPD